jgi:sialidase-1
MRLLSVLCVLVASGVALAQPQTRDYVIDGAPAQVEYAGEPWAESDGALEGRGTDSTLWAPDGLQARDFTITVRLSLETPVAHREDKEQISFPSGAALRVAGQDGSHKEEDDPDAWPAFEFDGNRFYLDSAHDGRMAIQGPELGERRLLPVRSRDYFRPGKAATLKIIRHGRDLAFAIDDYVVHMTKAYSAGIRQFGVRPGNSLVRVYEFSATGSLDLREDGLPLRSVLWRAGDGGYNTYRIPSLIALPDGVVLAFCEGRKRSASDAGDIDLLMRRSEDGGRSWADQQVIWDDGENTCGNPCPVFDSATGEVLLLMTHNPGNRHEAQIVSGDGARTVWLTTSPDLGKTWTPPREITQQVKAPGWTWYATGPGVGIELTQGRHAGRLVIPCDHKGTGETGGNFSHVILSDDHGATWRIGGITEAGANECQVVERKDGSLLLNMRRAREKAVKHRLVATSTDGGESWSSLEEDTALPEPECQASLIRVGAPNPDEVADVLLFSNPAGDERKNLTVRMSEDGGNSWPKKAVLHEGPAAYSCLTMLGDTQAACLFEAGELRPYETITLAIFGLEWVR